MKAMRMHRYGDPSVITEDDVPQPVPGPGEVLLRVAATSFNPSEAGLRQGLLRGVFDVDLPYTFGGDVSGTVVAGDSGDGGDGARDGEGGRGLAVGERVIGLLAGGAAAEYAVAPASGLVAAPVSIPLALAATIPIAGLTAWQAVVEHARPAAGTRVLVNGAGAVGRFAVPLVRRSGAYTIVALSPRAAEGMRRLGAHEVVERAELGRIEPVDVLINLVPADLAPLVPLIRPGGLLVSATTPVDGLAVRAVHFIARPSRDQLGELVRLIDAGELPVEAAAERPMGSLGDVHREAEEGRLPGKTILVPYGRG